MPLVYAGKTGEEPITESHERARKVKPSAGGFKAGLEILQARAGGNPTGLSLD